MFPETSFNASFFSPICWLWDCEVSTCSREKQHSTEWRGTDRKSKHLCRSQWGLRLRTMFIEIRDDPGIAAETGTHNAEPLCVMSLLIADIWVSLLRSGPYIADWSGLTERRTSHIWFVTIQSGVHVLRFDLILHYLIIDRKSRTFYEKLNKSQNFGICPEKLTGKPRTTIHKRFDGGIFYILFMCNFAHKVRRWNHGWSVLCQALYCRSSDWTRT